MTVIMLGIKIQVGYVLVKEGVTIVSYMLDEGLIEFSTGIDDGDYARYLNTGGLCFC